MAKNDFKAFATDRSANVISQEEWEALPALLSGFTAGKASSAQVNKVIRQASFIAAALAQFVSDKTQRDVLDNGDLPGFVELLGSGFAVEYLSRKNPFGDIKSDGTVQTALENLGLVNNGAVGRLIGMQIIKTSGTYTKTPGAMFADVIAIGGGGGGGWATSTANYNAAGGGGGGGGMARGLFNLSAISTVLVTIGAGGNGGIASTITNGTQGGTTTFGSYLSAGGGQPGNGCTASGSSASCGMGGQGGTSTVGALLCNGYAGLPGVMATPTAVGGTVGSGLGGGSFISGPGGYGAGGNGAATSGGTQNVNGNPGNAGVIIILEYA
ncbi:TPA: hypothetical protein JLJ42_002996 [Escherichia coli]|nr:hypothetical protein [Escherichia coli]